MTDLSKLSVLCGLLGAAFILLLTVVRQKRLDPSDFYSFVAAFFSASNIPPAAFFMWYAVNPDPILTQTRLTGQEKHIAMAGLVLLLASLIAIWKLCASAWTRTASPEPGKETPRLDAAHQPVPTTDNLPVEVPMKHQ